MSCRNMCIYGILTNCKEFFNQKHQKKESVLYEISYDTVQL